MNDVVRPSNQFVTFGADGRVTVDLSAFLRSPEGRRQIELAKALRPGAEMAAAGARKDLEGYSEAFAAIERLLIAELEARCTRLRAENERLEKEVRQQHAAYQAMFDTAVKLERQLENSKENRS